MASKTVEILGAVVDYIKEIPSYGKLGSVNPHARVVRLITDYPSVDVVFARETREQQPSFQAKRICTMNIYVHHMADKQIECLAIMNEIENVLRDNLTLGGLVTDVIAGDLESDLGELAQISGAAMLIGVEFTFRYHETEM